MPDEKYAEMMKEFVKSLEANDIEKALSFCTEDITFVSPYGTYVGKEKVRLYLVWMLDTLQNMKFTETGVGILVKRDKAVYEHIITGKHEGSELEFLAICTYLFENEKIKEVRDVFDRLTMADQAVKGWLPKKMVGAIVQQSRKGLD